MKRIRKGNDLNPLKVYWYINNQMPEVATTDKRCIPNKSGYISVPIKDYKDKDFYVSKNDCLADCVASIKLDIMRDVEILKKHTDIYDELVLLIKETEKEDD